MAKLLNSERLSAESNKFHCPFENGQFIKSLCDEVVSTSESNVGNWKRFHDHSPITNDIEIFECNLKTEVKLEYADDASPPSTNVNTVNSKSSVSPNKVYENGKSFPVKQEREENCKSNLLPQASLADADKLEQRNFQEKIPACYYSGSFTVTCPACDKSFKGGKHGLSSILKHVDTYHFSKSVSLKREVRAYLRKRKPCDCFACTCRRS